MNDTLRMLVGHIVTIRPPSPPPDIAAAMVATTSILDSDVICIGTHDAFTIGLLLVGLLVILPQGLWFHYMGVRTTELREAATRKLATEKRKAEKAIAAAVAAVAVAPFEEPVTLPEVVVVKTRGRTRAAQSK